MLGDAYTQAGQFEDAHEALDEGLAVAEKNDDRCHEAELHRLKGELLLAESPDQAAAAEDCFPRAIETARRQQSKAWELRATMSLARLWQRQGRRGEAHRTLAAVYGTYTEGSTTPDLVEAGRCWKPWPDADRVASHDHRKRMGGVRWWITPGHANFYANPYLILGFMARCRAVVLFHFFRQQRPEECALTVAPKTRGVRHHARLETRSGQFLGGRPIPRPRGSHRHPGMERIPTRKPGSKEWRRRRVGISGKPPIQLLRTSPEPS